MYMYCAEVIDDPLQQPGEQRGTISETRVTKFLNDVKAGNEQVRII